MRGKRSIRVYRVETNHGMGPYGQMKKWTKSYHNDEDHPSPWNDFGNGSIWDNWKGKMKDARFGFSNLSQLKRWFKVIERKNLRKLGYSVSIYTVDTRFIKVSKFQAMFDMTRAKLKDIKTLR